MIVKRKCIVSNVDSFLSKQSVLCAYVRAVRAVRGCVRACVCVCVCVCVCGGGVMFGV